MIKFFDIPGCGGMLSETQYATVIANTKISLCPRGNFPETFRIYESARIGSVIITDILEREWYFKNHPFIEIADWRRVGSVISELLNDEERLEQLGIQSRSWWQDIASPVAVGGFISRVILKSAVKLNKSATMA
jgi:hypothetical protein